ncbi:Hypothetical Protein FCC1311_025562 [Hondaea fermentalgiana]|uniref:Uncharacterized protein n=1 Tax=Hondaea fermentalgiana TaxID=2315210 RepID=A0A2R5G729_9STRA|nr:Hypothetical Protein FCC1311_025562 [Hondaea fermentalgiana]|eukprot:GBG26335.1 Hypothetical Protein FCC1311_025562 [Hondaea fermentalgiana]
MSDGMDFAAAAATTMRPPLDEAGKLSAHTVELISMTRDRLFQSYPVWLSVVVTAILGVYAILLTCAIVADAFILWSNIPGILDGSTDLVAVGQFSLHELIRLTWANGGYSSAIFIVVCSLIWPIVIVGLMLSVWFGELQLRTRSRILRWVSRLGTMSLYFFFFIFFLDSFLQVDFNDDTGTHRAIRGEPGWAVFVYLANVILLLVLTEWIYVLHYNAVYLLTWTLERETKSLRLKWYFGNANPLAASQQLRRDGPALGAQSHFIRHANRFESATNRSSRAQRREGWYFADNKEDSSGKKSPKSLSTDMEFIRGSYRFACSRLGEIVGIGVSIMIAALGVSAYSLPVFKQTLAFQLEGANLSPGIQVQYLTLPDIGQRLLPDIEPIEASWVAGVVFIVVCYFLLLFALPIVLHCISSFCAFFPVQHYFGKRFLRALCHAGNLLSVFAAFEVAMMVLIIFSYDVGMILLAMMERGGMKAADDLVIDGLRFGYCAQFEALTLCLGLSREDGIITGLLVAGMNIPFLYYFSETYHRHFGLVADGRNEQSYASGETTHKHRAEGCIVYLCYRGHCCSRKSYMFRQQSVDEDPYYRLQRSDNSFMEQVNQLEDGKYASEDAGVVEHDGDASTSDGKDGSSKPESGWRARRRSLAANFGRHSALLRGLPGSPGWRSPDGSGTGLDADAPPASADRPRRRSQRFTFSRSSSQPPILLQTAAFSDQSSPQLTSPGASSAPPARGRNESNVSNTSNASAGGQASRHEVTSELSDDTLDNEEENISTTQDTNASSTSSADPERFEDLEQQDTTTILNVT